MVVTLSGFQYLTIPLSKGQLTNEDVKHTKSGTHRNLDYLPILLKIKNMLLQKQSILQQNKPSFHKFVKK